MNWSPDRRPDACELSRIGVAVAGLRPLAITVPSAAAVLLVTRGHLESVPGGRLHPAWAYALVTALAIAFLAVAVIPRYPLAGAAALTILVITPLPGGRRRSSGPRYQHRPGGLPCIDRDDSHAIGPV